MRFAGFAMVMLLFGVGPVPAQPGAPSSVVTRPFRLDADGLQRMFLHCDQTTLAGAASTTRNALLTGAVTAVIEVLAADTPESRTASEFFSTLVSKLGPTATFGAINELQLRVYQGRGYKQTDRFEVCSSTIGPSQLALVRPVSPVRIPQQIIGYQNLATASLAELKSSIFGQEANSFARANFSTPPCTAHTNDIMSQMRLGKAGLYPLSGTISSRRRLSGPEPAAGARVDVIGPSPESCITSSDGQFDFFVRGGQYTVKASQAPGACQAL
jgi:hypothetical protein